MMPVEYKNPLENTYEEITPFIKIDARYCRENIKPYNIYKIAFRFPADFKLPTIA